MRFSLSLSHLSVLVACVSLASIVLVGFSLTHSGQGMGPITKAIGYLIVADVPVNAVPYVRATGFFDVYEPNMRFLLTVYAVITVVISGLLAILSARDESNSLWYSLALFASATVLAEISYLSGIVFFVVVGVVIGSIKKGKMTAR